jgi:Smr domain
VEDLVPPFGRVTAVRTVAGGTAGPGPGRLEPGRLTLCLVVDGLPIADLPAGARLRVGDAVVLELGAPAARGPRAAGAGLLEAGETDVVAADVLEGGSVAPGDRVTLESVAVPLTDVLDLHSFRPEDTPKVVAEYLGEARRRGLSEVRVVHGRGRGVQRAAVRRLLSELPGVVGFADAPAARGGWGATIVRLHPAGAAKEAPSE